MAPLWAAEIAARIVAKGQPLGHTFRAAACAVTGRNARVAIASAVAIAIPAWRTWIEGNVRLRARTWRTMCSASSTREDQLTIQIEPYEGRSYALRQQWDFTPKAGCVPRRHRLTRAKRQAGFGAYGTAASSKLAVKH